MWDWFFDNLAEIVIGAIVSAYIVLVLVMLSL
jgi:hypothetical protein